MNAFFDGGDEDVGEAPQAVPRQAPPPASATKKPAARSGNVRGFGDLRGGSDDEDEDKPVETFIGGAKRRAGGGPRGSLCSS